MKQINPKNPVPFYLQLSEIIGDWISSGTLRAGDMIPAEMALAKQYGVSRITVTKAVMKLVNEGLLYRKQGKGTFVADTKIIEHRLLNSPSFTEELSQQGLVSRTKLISINRIHCPDHVANRLGLTANDEVWEIERLRFANEQPVAIQTAYVPCSLFPVMDPSALEGSLYGYLKEQYGLSPNEADELYKSFALTGQAADMLDVENGSHGFFVKRLSISAQGIRFEYVETILRGDRFELFVKIHY